MIPQTSPFVIALDAHERQVSEGGILEDDPSEDEHANPPDQESLEEYTRKFHDEVASRKKAEKEKEEKEREEKVKAK